MLRAEGLGRHRARTAAVDGQKIPLFRSRWWTGGAVVLLGGSSRFRTADKRSHWWSPIPPPAAVGVGSSLFRGWPVGCCYVVAEGSQDEEDHEREK
jgi:hypothetical protein